MCGADYVSYGNECVAKCANVLIRSNGSCPACKITVGCECCPGRRFTPPLTAPRHAAALERQRLLNIMCCYCVSSRGNLTS